MVSKRTRSGTLLDAISRHVELQRGDAGTVKTVLDDMDYNYFAYVDQVNSYGFLPREFDDAHEDIDMQVRGVH